ncbi:MAG: D-Ala-D-Ala carboxypeptidase family metallohydrolase [Prevotella sp.]|nr:D-Ala-D-Ala carboxypeptidase family metallohydrolase [Prevotella sp.]
MKDIQLSKHLTSSSALILSHSNKLDDLRLTEHFKLSEFTKSSTASARGIDNTPNEQQVANLKRLCQEVLEPLRQHFGVPIIIGSGFRCPKLNKLVGGVSNSQHMTGEACDIHLSDQKKLREWFTWLMDNTNFDHYQNLNLIKSRVCSKYSTDCVSREVLIIMFDNNICSHEQRPA